jgi:hypothetical protein
MTDVIRPANGQAANAQSSGNAWQDPHRTSGYDAAIGERTLVALESGEARAWPKRPGPGAVHPAGWFLPTDGEAAPPFRSGMEPARSDETARPLWPWTFPAGSRPVPVVGPTESLRGRAADTAMAVPPGAVSTGATSPGAVAAGLLDPAQPSSWQLAQEVWQESGVTWERTAPELADAEPAADWFPDDDPAAFEQMTDESPNASPPGPAHASFRPFDPEPASVSAWRTDPNPEDPGSPPYEPAANGWSGYSDPQDPGSAASEPPAADAGFADPDPEDAGPSETWFTGVGPADTRLADAANDPWAAAQRTGDDGTGRRAVLRPSQPRPNPTRPEPIGADLARDDAMRPGPAWNGYPPDGFPGQAWPAGSARVPLGAPVALEPQAPDYVDLAGPDDAALGWAGGTALSEPDELFRAWQGSVNEAAAAHGAWSVTRRAASASRRRRALQAAAIGVPVAVIVTVGAGAVMILTGKANDMLAVRADTGVASAAATATGTSGTNVGPGRAAGSVPPAFVAATLSGYPGQRGAVTVASMTTAAGITLAVGTADGHPAIWHRASNGSWTLESAATLNGVTGSAGLTSVAHGPAGWIAVGATSTGRATEPVILASADGVRWQPVASLADQAGAGTEFLGVAAGRSGYAAVGRQMIGGRTFAVLWYSADLRSWTSESNDGLDGRLAASTANAVTATADGFVAVGSHGADQSMWISSDGRIWRLDYVPTPDGASSATLSSVVASGTNVVAGGYAATRAGDIPVVVVSADGGVHWRQVVLQAPDGLGVITALTAAPGGFTAAGVVGRSGAQRAVTWTSPDGLTWSAPAQASGSEITALTVAGSTVAGTAEQGSTPTLVRLPAP